MYVQKQTTELSAGDCRHLKNACGHARELGYPLNTHATFAPYPASLPAPAARASAFNLLRTNIDNQCRRHLGVPLTGLWVWHSDVTGRNPHVHLFIHCPARLREDLNRNLVAIYPASVIDVREGSDIRKLHHSSGLYGSTLDYLMRFKSQQAYWADSGKTWRASNKLTIVDDKTGRPRTVNRGIKSPITGKRWGCTRNISPKAVEAHLAAQSAERERTRRAA